MKFSEKIVFMRKKRGISQDRLAKKMGVSRQTIYKWEADLNTPEFNKIEHLSEILGISYDLLLDDSVDLNEHFSDENDTDTSEQEARENEDLDKYTPEDNESKGELNKKRIIIIALTAVLAVILIISMAILISSLLKDKINTTDTQSSSDTTIDTEEKTDTSTDTNKDTDATIDTDIEKIIFVYFDARGGEVSEKSRKIPLGEKIGELPVPIKNDMSFAHWEDANGNKISKSTVIEADSVLYAVYENLSSIVTLKLNPNGGGISKSEISITKGGFVYDYLPIPTHDEGLRFLGWFDQRGVKAIPSSRYTSDQLLTAYWDKLDICPYTKSDHDFAPWNCESIEADCENDGIKVRTCRACLYEEIEIVNAAFGHSYGETAYGTMYEESTCIECGYIKKIQYINLNDTCIGNTMITGNIHGREYYYAVFDGYFDNFAGPGCAENEEMIIDIYLKEYTYIDYIYTHGWGNMNFKISVITPPSTDYQEIGEGSFGEEPQKFKINGYVLAIRIYTDNAEGYWQEIALAKKPQ